MTQTSFVLLTAIISTIITWQLFKKFIPAGHMLILISIVFFGIIISGEAVINNNLLEEMIRELGDR